MNKKLIGILLSINFIFTGCSTNNQISNNNINVVTTSNDDNDIETTKELLANATNIKIKKEFFAFNNSYDIYINDNKIGTVSGKFINLTGDIFTFETNNGYILGEEKQIKRWGVKLNRLAEIKDDKNTVIGYIGEEKIKDLFKYGYNFHLYDENKNEIGYTKDIFFSLLDKYEVYNSTNEKICIIEEQFTLNNQYILTIQDNNNIPVEFLIYLTCILDAISTSKSSSSAMQMQSINNLNLNKK